MRLSTSEHGGEARRLEAKAAHIEHAGARGHTRDAKLTAVAGDRANALCLVQRDLGAGEAVAKTVAHAPDQDRRE
jgi:hypothetical protein